MTRTTPAETPPANPQPGTEKGPAVPHINAIGTALGGQDIHQAFIAHARDCIPGVRERRLFDRMVARAGIDHRYSVLPGAARMPGASPVSPGGFYEGGFMPPTSARMTLYANHAPALAMQAVAALAAQTGIGGRAPDGVTHLVLASCTGFTAPGIDQTLIASLGLDAGVERTLVGFMGCYAGATAIRQAYHIVRSVPSARVLVVAVELCTLHLQAASTLEGWLAMLLFGDGAAAALVTAVPRGLAITAPVARALPDSGDAIRWDIGDTGFHMHLSGAVPGRIGTALADPDTRAALTGGRTVDDWAVHAGGRSVLDAVEGALGLSRDALAASRAVLARGGNLSSATLLHVLAAKLASVADAAPIEHGCALAFGPGLAVEGFHYRSAGVPA